MTTKKFNGITSSLVQLRVSLNGVDLARGEVHLTLFVQPMLVRMIPDVGTSGVSVQVIGYGPSVVNMTNYNSSEANIQCRFSTKGGLHPPTIVNASNYIWSPSAADDDTTEKWEGIHTLVCIVPESTGEEVDGRNEEEEDLLRVSLNGGSDFTDTTLSFTRRRPLRLFSFQPDSGTELGGTIVHLRGLNFHPPSRGATLFCSFGNHTKKIPATFLDGTHLTCVAPAAPPGVSILVLLSDNVSYSLEKSQRATSDSMYYTHLQQSFVSNVTPSRAMDDGWTSVMVTGGNFHRTGNQSCRFGDVVVIALYINNTSLQCNVPPLRDINLLVGTEERRVMVEVTSNGVDYVAWEDKHEKKLYLEYVQRPIVINVVPTSVVRRSLNAIGVNETSTKQLLVRGENFLRGHTRCVLTSSSSSSSSTPTAARVTVVAPAVVSENGTSLTCSVDLAAFDGENNFIVGVTTTTSEAKSVSRESHVRVLLIRVPEIVSCQPLRVSLASPTFVGRLRVRNLHSFGEAERHVRCLLRIGGHVVSEGRLEIGACDSIPLGHRVVGKVLLVTAPWLEQFEKQETGWMEED